MTASIARPRSRPRTSFQIEITSGSISRHTRTPSDRVTVTSDFFQKIKGIPVKARERGAAQRPEREWRGLAGNHSASGLAYSLLLHLFFSLFLSLLCRSLSITDSFVSPYEIPGFVEFPPREWHGSPSGWQGSSTMGRWGWVHSWGWRPPTRYGRLQQPCKVQRGGIGIPLPSTTVFLLSLSLFLSSLPSSLILFHRSAPPVNLPLRVSSRSLRSFSLPLFTSGVLLRALFSHPSSSFLVVVGGDNSSSASARTSGWFLCSPSARTSTHTHAHTRTRRTLARGDG